MERELTAGSLDPAIVLAVQGAIAAADALSIHHRGQLAASDRHADALEILRGLDLPGIEGAARHFARLLRAKGESEYGDRTPRQRDAEALVEHARRLFEFVE